MISPSFRRAPTAGGKADDDVHRPPDRFAPKPRGSQPAARQCPRPDAEIAGGEVRVGRFPISLHAHCGLLLASLRRRLANRFSVVSPSKFVAVSTSAGPKKNPQKRTHAP